ncbi:2-alkenal reductase [Peptoclostridium litorale DSM 5388]|uniref:Putative periplasmic serine endoprotease DegP n=1 Tax=Peptoclostridium litorale DSM 5388 TaxID=1121324 RepID=A0A069RF30_PEPLI|nr:trypsin-like peptidase domain-containing protein [Peptoclostridium litorale]KDR95408.1 putative periplasmic serine endoprotease DegP [Peptoclostridium litorale DSM 5388]SIO19396.1 2-alkenal reductase [Peptoclostridium litorale DSM 5388]
MKKYLAIFLICMILSSTGSISYAQLQSAVEADRALEMAKAASQQLQSIPEVIESVSESVVAIIGENKMYREEEYIYSKFPRNLQHGSGVIVSSDGKILTNNHVIDGLEEIFVVMHDGSAYKAELLYGDADIDLALIKINRSALKPISFADEGEIDVGDDVLAIGTPLFFGYRNSASKGIISGLDRPVGSSYTYLQTDAAMNPGNSGGPLINMDGELVGINAQGYTYFSGMNFSIPIGNVNYFMDHYNKFGKIRRCFTGIGLEENWAALVGLPTNQGIKVVMLQKDAVVSSSQVKEGDMLEAIDGKKTTSIAAYNEILKGHLPGDRVTLTFSSGDSTFDVQVTLKEVEEDK